MEYTPSLLSDGAYDPRHHKTFKTTRLPDNIKEELRTRWYKAPSVMSYSDCSNPPPPLAKILLERCPYLEHELAEPGKCEGLGPSSSTFTLFPVPQGFHLPTAFSPRIRVVMNRAVFAAPGLVSEMVELVNYSQEARLKLAKQIRPHVKRQLRKRCLDILGLPLVQMSNPALFRMVIHLFRTWVQDDRCPTSSWKAITNFLEVPEVLLLMDELNI